MNSGHDDEASGFDDGRSGRMRDVVNATILDALPSAVALLDERGVIRSVNVAWVRFAIERPDDPLVADPGTSYRDLLDRIAERDPGCRDVADAIRSVLDGSVDLASADYPAEGARTTAWFTLRVVPVDMDGERWTVVSFEDVTSLRHALERWHATFSDAAVPTILVDKRGQVVDANTAFAQLVGTDLPSTIRRSARDFVHPDDHAAIELRIARALEGRPLTIPQELKLLRADGATAVVMMHPASITPGQRRGAVVQLIDITQQRRAEARLALHRELLELVAAGTPLADVATAVALNVGRAVDGATGAVVLAGGAPFLAPGVSASELRRGWSVPLDRSRAARGELVVLPTTSAMPEPDEVDAAEMLASVVRLALQRDEAATSMSSWRDAASLPTGELFDQEVARTVDWAGRRESTVAVLAIGDLGVDELIATVGWRGAEAALAELAVFVRAAVPSAAMVARRGQHILVLVAAAEHEVNEVVDHLRRRHGVAVGVATARGGGTDPDALVDEAEEALAVLRLRTDEDAAAADLRRALDEGEIDIHYQPIVDLGTGATVSLEALVRWHHRTRGLVPAPEVIHVAETSGLVHEVGVLVLTAACRDLATFVAAGAADLTVAVNLSARQLADPGLVELVKTALDEAGLEPSALVVEITESAVVDDVDVVAGALGALRDLGVRVAIDDFGTGYSSLLYLKRFPADVLKVDRSFVHGLGVHEGDTAIVDAVVGLGHRLGLEVVAEGVETDDQLAELRRRRCDHAQGHLLQRPMPAAEVGAFLGTGAIELGPTPPAIVEEDDLQIDELLSLVTHELSTPLAVIGGHAELLVDRMREDEDVEVIGALERNIKNLDELLRTLSGLGQALSDAAPRTVIDLAPFVEQTANDLAPLLARHHVRTTIGEEPASAEVEPVSVRQIVTNLLSNAVKFTEPGTTIDISVRRGEGCHEIVVSDHGPGVPPEREDELFGRFSRLGTTARGLGLGLHLSRALARRQGGDLVHQRTEGGGATFVLRLPA